MIAKCSFKGNALRAAILYTYLLVVIAVESPAARGRDRRGLPSFTYWLNKTTSTGRNPCASMMFGLIATVKNENSRPSGICAEVVAISMR